MIRVSTYKPWQSCLLLILIEKAVTIYCFVMDSTRFLMDHARARAVQNLIYYQSDKILLPSMVIAAQS